MSVFDLYFTIGLNVEQIVHKTGKLELEVRKELRSMGLPLPDDAVEDRVTEAVRALGYSSFAEFVKGHQLRSLKDQARDLGVSRHALSNVYDVYRKFVTSEHS